MSEPQPKKTSNFRTYIFIIILCFCSALILSIAAALLKKPQEEAKTLDRLRQLLIATKLLSYDGYFLIQEGNKFVPAKYDRKQKILVKGSVNDTPSGKDIFEIYNLRVKAMLVNDKGELYTFEKAALNEEKYLEDHQYTGYSQLPNKLIYIILPNQALTKEQKKEALSYAYVIPVKGFGLWAAIYGYLALEADADTVLGTTWYDQKETAGLGAVIADAAWQNQFYNKVIFLSGQDGTTDFKTTHIGLTVVKGSVKDVYGSTPKANSAVDGIPGATLTCNGVTIAYHESLAPYRPFLILAHERSLKNRVNK